MAKRGGESFSDVVRRATISESPVSGATLRAYYRAGGSKVSERFLDSIEKAARHDA